MTDIYQLKSTLYIALFAALISAGAFIILPIGPVPIVLQNMFIILAGLVLGPRSALICVSIYLLAGGLGLPVFAGGTGGIAKFAGPTGGYLVGYLPAVFAVGVISQMGGKKGKIRFTMDIFAGIVGVMLIFICGVPWLKIVLGVDWGKAFSLGMLPFLIGDVLKVIVAASLAPKLRSVLAGNWPHSGSV